jgi:hypothetical protein
MTRRINKPLKTRRFDAEWKPHTSFHGNGVDGKLTLVFLNRRHICMRATGGDIRIIRSTLPADIIGHKVKLGDISITISHLGLTMHADPPPRLTHPFAVAHKNQRAPFTLKRGHLAIFKRIK